MTSVTPLAAARSILEIASRVAASRSSDPVAAVAADGTVYVAATDSTGAVWAARYTAGSGLLGWVSGGLPGSVAATGKPAITIGSDQAAYVAVRTSDNALWAARVQGGVWGAWSSGASNLRMDPALAAGGNGLIYVLVNPASGPLAVLITVGSSS